MTTPDLSSEFQASTAGRAEVLADLEKWLELDKLTVIRGGWKLPDTFERARKSYYDETCSWHGGKENDKWYKETKAAFDEQVALASDSLRQFIAQQDAEIAAKLSAQDLQSLLRLGHVTLRSSATQPVSAVVVFDPIEDGAAPDRNWALSHFFNGGTFADAWSTEKAAEAIDKLKVADFIENFDINPLDLYAHKVLMRVHYALRHENQLVNMHGRLDEERTRASHQSFADLTEYEYPAEYTPYYGQRERNPAAETSAEVDCFRYLNRWDHGADKTRKPAFGHDDRFYAKLVRLEAVGALFPISFGDEAETILRRFAGEPNRGWMHYYGRTGEEISRKPLTREHAEAITKGFTEKLIHVLKEGRPPKEENPLNPFTRVFDLRVLVPAFKKLYDADESKGTERAFLNIIHQGLEKFFPTLLQSPVPEWTKESEPPQTVAGYKQPQAAPGAKPSSP